MIVDGRYRVLETILDSESRSVYLTEHQLIRRRMVVKVLHADAATRADMVARFVSEAEAAGRLRHPNIVESIDMGFVEGRPFVVFEHLQGSRLSEEITRLGRLSVRRAVHVARQIAAALGAAHLEGIVHGALEAEKVFLVDRETDPDFVKVLGLGKPSLGDPHRGCPEMLSPEEILGAEVDHRCDVWTLGVLLFEMIVGKRPFSADAGAATARRRIVSAEAPRIDRPDVPAELVAVIEACLSKHPDDRFQDMAELDQALAPFDVRFARGSSTTIPPLPSLARIRRPSAPQGTVTPNSPSMQLPVQPNPSPTQTLVVARPRISKPALAACAGAAVLCAAGLWLALTRGTESAPASSRSVAAAATPQVGADTLGAAGATIDRSTAPIAITIEADVPGARVTFRRRISATPLTIEAPPADMVELVEVSAPGHKTVRYWITFDRATHLRARLVEGAGLGEASELDTLVALGETADEEIAAAPAERTARETDRARKSADRKKRGVGRTADTAAPAADQPVVPSDSAPEFAVRVPGGADANEAAVAARPDVKSDVKADKVSTKSDTVDVGTLQVAPVTPAPTAPAAPRQVAAGFLEANRIAGNARILPDNATRQAMRHVGETRVTGRFKLCVTAGGAVSKVSMTSSSGHHEYDELIAHELRGWRFKPIAIGGTATAVCASIAVAYSQQ